MMRISYLITAVFLVGIAGPARAAEAGKEKLTERVASIEERIKAEVESLLALYKSFHRNPELSLQEEHTSARLAKELKDCGFEVTEKVGGYGVVGVLKNGKGPTVLVRTDMDALPVVGGDAACPTPARQRVRDKNGNEVGVMHACGHDMHMTCWAGTARVLAALKDRWQGTLVFIGQPAEEIGTGARLMLAGRPVQEVPQAGLLPGPALRSARSPTGTSASPRAWPWPTSIRWTSSSRARAATARPRTRPSIPIVLAARIVLDLQTIVSRETNPTDPAVVTVGSIHGGTKHNIIPNEVKLQLTVRTTKDATRKHILEAIERIAKAAAQGRGRRSR